jgi:DtxR family Mn-dependent transcriptional regulator
VRFNCSVSEENYLKAIFHLQQADGKVTTSVLAEKLNTRPASVTDMMKKLNTKKLLHYKPYYGFSLSNDGKRVALDVIRRHRLWEFFLAEKLNFSWDEVHSVAEDLEHVSSRKLIDKLDEYLGFPRFDPHGDPIPDHRGKMSNRNMIPLGELPPARSAEVCQVKHQSQEMLELLQHRNIQIGTQLEVKRHFVFDHSIELRIGKSLVTISSQLAKNIFVTYVV